jgi:hypothetical protein
MTFITPCQDTSVCEEIQTQSTPCKESIATPNPTHSTLYKRQKRIIYQGLLDYDEMFQHLPKEVKAKVPI